MLSKVPGLVTYTNLKEQMLQISVDGIDPHAQTMYSRGDTNHCGWRSIPGGGSYSIKFQTGRLRPEVLNLTLCFLPKW